MRLALVALSAQATDLAERHGATWKQPPRPRTKREICKEEGCLGYFCP